MLQTNQIGLLTQMGLSDWSALDQSDWLADSDGPVWLVCFRLLIDSAKLNFLALEVENKYSANGMYYSITTICIFFFVAVNGDQLYLPQLQQHLYRYQRYQVVLLAILKIFNQNLLYELAQKDLNSIMQSREM
jgi:hypothetical protein